MYLAVSNHRRFLVVKHNLFIDPVDHGLTLIATHFMCNILSECTEVA